MIYIINSISWLGVWGGASGSRAGVMFRQFRLAESI